MHCFLLNCWWLLFIVHVALICIFVPHVLLKKEDERAAWGWIIAILFYPIAGCCLYVIFGVNRIRRRAQTDRVGLEKYALPPFLNPQSLYDPSYGGHCVEMFQNGDEAYPAMLKAIDQAQEFIFFSTYVFRGDTAGCQFVEAFAKAKARGVEIRILIDGFGIILHTPFCSAVPFLKKVGIRHARFLYSLWPWRMPYLNLRNHQKILVIDGKCAFTGGINVSDQNVLAGNGNGKPEWKIIDCHFRVEGPAVQHALAAFQKEWFFTTHEDLRTFKAQSPSLGHGQARGLSAGPDHNINPINWAILERLVQAKAYVMIASPYFLPDQSLVEILCLVARMGIRIDIIIPAQNNMPFVEWAGATRLQQLIASGCHVYKSIHTHFDHSKLMVVDDLWVLFGSHNWDARSTRLNFEFNIECIDRSLAQKVVNYLEEKKKIAKKLVLGDFENRSFLIQLRDGLARLFSPYL